MKMYLFEKKGHSDIFFEKLFRIFCFKGLGVSGLVWVFELRSRTVLGGLLDFDGWRP